jgi:hypothetical protein
MAGWGACIVDATPDRDELVVTMRSCDDRLSIHKLRRWDVASSSRVWVGDGLVAKHASSEGDWADELAARRTLEHELDAVVPFVVSTAEMLLTVMPRMDRWGVEHTPSIASYRALVRACRELHEARVLYFDMRASNTLVDRHGRVRLCDLAELYPPRRLLAMLAAATTDCATRDELVRRVDDATLRVVSPELAVSLVPEDLAAVVRATALDRHVLVRPQRYGCLVALRAVERVDDIEAAVAAVAATWRLLTAWSLHRMAATLVAEHGARLTTSRLAATLELRSDPLAHAAVAAHATVARIARDPLDPAPFEALLNEWV